MARKNRISVPNGIYHVTTRIAHGAMLLKSDAVKERVVSAMHKTAAFSGVELYAWCVMDNHIHMLVHVPNVPKQYRVNPDIDPPSYAFGMRPAECRIPIWSKDDDVPIKALPRPPLEFKLPDEELLRRIRILYDAKTAEKKLNNWNAAIATGVSYIVEEEKERYFRRMYNISQFMKTFKERVTKMFNEDYGHKGALWQGRFYSGLVENTSQVLSIVAAYIDYNPVKARLTSTPSAWRWNSFSTAMGDGDLANKCRKMYERMLGLKWPEAKTKMEAIFADKLPDDLSAEKLQTICDYYDDESAKAEYYREHPHQSNDEKTKPWKRQIRASQAIRVTLKIFKGAFIGSVEFALKTIMSLPTDYPMHKTRSAKRCRALDWREPIVA